MQKLGHKKKRRERKQPAYHPLATLLSALALIGVFFFLDRAEILVFPRLLPLIDNPAPSSTTAEPSSTVPPDSAKITGVPFIPQAPLQIWDVIHEETCEEAAVLTLHHFWQGGEAPPPQTIERELLEIIEWEKDNLKIFEDTTVAQTARILQEYFGYGDRVRIITNATLDDLKREIAAGRPVIVPAAGRLLNNRFFQTPGPIYHMVVVTGYTDARDIITNDPGTRHGKAFRYPQAGFWEAVHDFVDRTDAGMARGAKTLLVIDPPPVSE